MVDAFCKAGGATKGYQRAGFYVVGVDIEPQPNYCGDEFYQMDAMVLLDEMARGTWSLPTMMPDATHASPPCQDHSTLSILHEQKHGTGWMLAETRRQLRAAGLPYVIENVEGADMPGALVLCGSEFGLRTRTDLHGEVWLKRHRKFESNIFLWGAGGCHCYANSPSPSMATAPAVTASTCAAAVSRRPAAKSWASTG